MSKFNFLENANTSPHKDAVLDEGGVWRDPIYLDAEGSVTTKNKAVSFTLVPPPPDERYRWDSTASEWVCKQAEQAASVSMKIYKYKTDASAISVAPAMLSTSSITVIKE